MLNLFKSFGFAVLMSCATAISAGNGFESTIEMAKQGDVEAQFNLTMMYANAEAVPVNAATMPTIAKAFPVSIG